MRYIALIALTLAACKPPVAVDDTTMVTRTVGDDTTISAASSCIADCLKIYVWSREPAELTDTVAYRCGLAHDIPDFDILAFQQELRDLVPVEFSITERVLPDEEIDWGYSNEVRAPFASDVLIAIDSVRGVETLDDEYSGHFGTHNYLVFANDEIANAVMCQ